MSRNDLQVGAGRRLATAVGVLLLSAGCANTDAPVQAVPELHTSLSQVDRAIVQHRPGQARRQLKQLIRTTVQAQDAGRLDSAQADAVLAAAAGLLNALPRPEPRPQPVPTTPAPQPSTPAPEGNHEGHGHGHGHGEGHGNLCEGHRNHGRDSDESD